MIPRIKFWTIILVVLTSQLTWATPARKLPFLGIPVAPSKWVVTQGNNECCGVNCSHCGNLEYSWDYVFRWYNDAGDYLQNVTVNQPVLAGADGIAYLCDHGGISYGQDKDAANYNHGWGRMANSKYSDDTYGRTSHYTQSFCLLGQYFKQGQPTGIAGTSGFSIGGTLPYHIHDHVANSNEKIYPVTIPSSYEDAGNPIVGSSPTSRNDGLLREVFDGYGGSQTLGPYDTETTWTFEWVSLPNDFDPDDLTSKNSLHQDYPNGQYRAQIHCDFMGGARRCFLIQYHMLDYWQQFDGPKGIYGLPTSDTFPLPDGRLRQNFQKGYVITFDENEAIGAPTDDHIGWFCPGVGPQGETNGIDVEHWERAHSYAFTDAYNRNGGGQYLGDPHSETGDDCVHRWEGTDFYVQGFDSGQYGYCAIILDTAPPDPLNDKYQCCRPFDDEIPGDKTLYENCPGGLRGTNNAYVLRSGFWNAYRGEEEVYVVDTGQTVKIGGPASLGIPISDEYYNQDGRKRQDFEKGYLVWMGDIAYLHDDLIMSCADVGQPPQCLPNEICNNGRDDDCDGQVDEGCPVGCDNQCDYEGQAECVTWNEMILCTADNDGCLVWGSAAECVSQDQYCCVDQCVYLDSDPDNCGQCGWDCDPGIDCVNGLCDTPDLGETCDGCNNDSDCADGFYCGFVDEDPEVNFCLCDCDLGSCRDQCNNGFYCHGTTGLCTPEVRLECIQNSVFQVACERMIQLVESCESYQNCVDGRCESTGEGVACSICDRANGNADCAEGYTCAFWSANPEVQFCACDCALGWCRDGCDNGHYCSSSNLCTPEITPECASDRIFNQDSCGNFIEWGTDCAAQGLICENGICVGGPASCPFDTNGLYCGSNPNVPPELELNPAYLYDCQNGDYRPVQNGDPCPYGCEVMPQGHDDQCAAGSNSPPVAILSISPTSYTVPAGGTATVWLDWSASFDPDGDDWSFVDAYSNGHTIGVNNNDGLRGSIGLGVGSHQIYVVISDDQGHQMDSNEITVTVTEESASCPNNENGLYCYINPAVPPGDFDDHDLLRCTDGDYSLVTHCPYGCTVMPQGYDDECADPPAECTSGPCCDTSTNTFRQDGYVCLFNYDVEYGCYQGEDCGDDVYFRYRDFLCDGHSTTCMDPGPWKGWTVYESCDASAQERCVDGYTSCRPCDCDCSSGEIGRRSCDMTPGVTDWCPGSQYQTQTCDGCDWRGDWSECAAWDDPKFQPTYDLECGPTICFHFHSGASSSTIYGIIVHTTAWSANDVYWRVVLRDGTVLAEASSCRPVTGDGIEFSFPTSLLNSLDTGEFADIKVVVYSGPGLHDCATPYETPYSSVERCHP